MPQLARLAVIQPARPAALLSAREKEDPETYRNHAHRLDLAHDDFDLAFKQRVIEETIEQLADLLEEAGDAGCDLALLPECCLPIGDPKLAVRERMAEVCLWAEERWLARTRPLARQHDMLIASCYYRAEPPGSAGVSPAGDPRGAGIPAREPEAKLHNDAVLMDERGEVAGIYHKVHLPCPLEWDLTEAGVFEAGSEYPLFETRIGRVGFLICYDIDFPEAAACYALQGADLLLHPTVGYNFPDEEEVVGEARLRTRATDHSVPIAYANFGPAPGRSAIYSHNGNQLVCAGRQVEAVAFADVELGGPRPINWGDDLPYGDHRERLARKRRPDTYGLLTERVPPLLAAKTEPGEPFYEYVRDVGLD